MREEADHVGETSSDGRMEEDRFLLITTVGINVGGQDFGISPGEGSVCFTLRAGSDARMNDVEKELADEAKRLAEIHALRFIPH
jgi:metal-dependent amidase/aminoacylase/carboxypeptidase family protein